MEDLAIDVVKSMTSLVASQAWDEIRFVWGFHDHLDKLKERFLDIQEFLRDVGNSNHEEKSRRVNRWLQKVEDVVYHADNVIDDHTYEILRRKVRVGKKNLSCKKKMHNFFSYANNPIFFRVKMTHKVLDILSKLDELDKEAKTIGLKQVKLAKEALTSSTSQDDDVKKNLDQIRKYAAASASEFIGRDADKKKLIEMLYNSENKNQELSIIAIVGIGGLGKTTLARAIYDHEKVATQYDQKMWICVSEDFNVGRLLKEMVESLYKEKCDLTNDDVIKQELQEKLKDKKFLLVLDDVWCEDRNLWDVLKTQLKDIGGAKGSVMLVTSRSKNVATNAGDVKPHELKGLCKKESWDLFKKKVKNVPSSFEGVGERIVGKCKGVPLAITSIAGLLTSREMSIREWELIEKSDVWDASSQLQENNPNYIMPSLLLSYHHLPLLSSKQCFAYCAIFPKDHIMKKNELIDLWIAQGFLHKGETRSDTFSEMEKRGEECFNTLLNISFLQLEKDDFVGRSNVTLGIWKCKMHDLVHDLATHIFKKDMFVWDGKVEPDTSFNYRHLVLNFSEEESGRIADKVVNEEIMQQVRTVNIWSIEPCWDMLKQTRYLRTLIMDGIRIKDELLSIIGESKHLRYLDLSCNSIEALPDSICRLYQLQVLILLYTKLRELPKDLHRLVSLRRLEISTCVCRRLPIIDLGRLPDLRVLCLYHFYKVECIGEEVDDINQSNGITRSNLNRDVKGFFPSLRELRIHNCPNLKTLNLVPSTNATTSVVKPLFPCLEILDIFGCRKLEVVKTSPTLSFESLKILNLHLIAGIEGPVDIIKYHKSGSLTCLIVRQILDMRSLPEALSYCTRLERLEIEYCSELECLPAGMNSLVYLKEVVIRDCESLVSIPDDMFKGSSSLRKLIIRACRRLEKIPSSLAECTSLEDLQISECTSLKHPIPDLSRLHVLVSLEVIQTTSMAAFKLEWIPCLPRLQDLIISLFPVEDEIESKMWRQFSNKDHIDNGNSFCHRSLVTLHLSEAENNKFKSLPRQLLQLHLPSLKRLVLSDFKELEELPVEGIGTVSSLEELQLDNCNNLRFLPSKKNLSQLQRLSIHHCPKMERRIMPKHGGLPEWQKVSHVPFIQINRRTVQGLER